jgi:hypothetical protein
MTTALVTFWELEESQFLARLRTVIEELKLVHTASQLKEVLQLESMSDLDQPIQKAIETMQLLNMSSRPHFQQVYCAQNNSIQLDWRLSSFAYLLIILNCDPKHPMVAKTQVELIKNQISS